MNLIKTNTNIEEAKRKIILSVKGSKKKPYGWLSIVDSITFLKQKSFSIEKIAQIAAVSKQTIRQISKLSELTVENKKRLSENRILMDAAYRLAGIKDKKLQNFVGKIIENMNSHEQREVIQFAKKNPSSSKDQFNKFKKEVIKSKPLVKDINVIILGLENELYDKLKDVAKKEKISITKLVIIILKEWNKTYKER